MQFLIIGCVILLVIVGKALYDTYDAKRKRSMKMRRLWGCLSEEDIPHSRLQTIDSFYESIKEEDLDIDAITWSDLDLGTLFLDMNQTYSAPGEEYLYALLRKPIVSKEEREARDQLIEYFLHHKEEREKLGSILLEIGKLRQISIFEYLNMVGHVKRDSNLKHIICLPLLAASIGCFFVSIAYGVLAFLAALGYCTVSYYSRKGKIGKYFNVLSYILGLLNGTKKICKLTDEAYAPYVAQCHDILGRLSGFKTGSFFVMTGRHGEGGFGDILMDYIRLITHFDLVKFNGMIGILQRENEALVELFTLVGRLDAMISIASYRTYLGLENISKPEFHDGKVAMEVENLFHPMIENAVKASFDEKSCVLITGSNASGKSTFLKEVAMNALLAQTTNTALATKYKANVFRIFSSMALRDNIFENESYFIVEIKSLKRIIDRIHDEVPMLCFVDEVLRGTNTLERIAASSQILLNISGKNAMCFAATHDNELTYILEKHYSNYHFTEDVVNNHVEFSYEFLKGRATSRNAIRLLSMLGYEDAIVKRADESVQAYLESGNWTIFE